MFLFVVSLSCCRAASTQYHNYHPFHCTEAVSSGQRLASFIVHPTTGVIAPPNTIEVLNTLHLHKLPHNSEPGCGHLKRAQCSMHTENLSLLRTCCA